jgi:Na+/melibiose symporter-like transporter
MLSRMSKNSSTRVIAWWFVVLAAALLALLVAWAARVVRVPTATLLTIAVVAVALSWLVVLVTVPWNLYFAARRAAQEMAVSRDRGITVRADYDDEARRISRRMLRFALGGHVGTAIAAAVIAYASGNKTGYYVAGIFLLATMFRPASAYLFHVRERIGVFTRESMQPRDDVITLGERMDEVSALARQSADDLHRIQASLADTVAHNRNLLGADLSRLRETQEADRAQAQARHDELKRQLDQMVRRIEATLDGISDHQELLTGLRALVRMVRSEPL